MSLTSNLDPHLRRWLALACLMVLFVPPAHAQDDKGNLTDVEFRGREHVDLKAIEDATGLKKGARVDLIHPVRTYEKLRALYRDKGYPDAQVKLSLWGQAGDLHALVEIVEDPKSVPGLPTPLMLHADPIVKVSKAKPKDESFQLAELMGIPVLTADGSGLASMFLPKNTGTAKTLGSPPGAPPAPVRLDDRDASAKTLPPDFGISTAYARKATFKDATEAILANPRSANSYRPRARLFANRNLNFQAIADLNEAIRLDPNDPVDVIQRGICYCQERHLDRGLADIERGLALSVDDPTRIYAYSCRATAHHLRGDYALAVADLDRAIELQPGQADTLGERGWARYKLGDLDRAVNDLTKSIELEPTAFRWWRLGQSHFLKGDYAQAEFAYERASQLQPGSSYYPTYAAMARVAQGQVDRAISDLDAQLAKTSGMTMPFEMPTQTIILTARGWAYQAKGDLARAKADFDQAIELSRTRIMMGFEWAGVGKTGHTNGTNFDRQLATFEERSRLRPDLFGVVTVFQGDEARNHRSQIPMFAAHFTARRKDDGSAMVIGFSVTSQSDPDSKSAHIGRAIVALRQADWKEAWDRLNDAVLMFCEERSPGSTCPTLLDFLKEL